MSDELNRITAKRLARSVAIDAQATDCHYEHIFTELQIAQKRGEVIGRRSEPLLAAYERFKHLDGVLCQCETLADDPIYKTCGELWQAIKASLGKEPSLPVPAVAVVTEPPKCEECELASMDEGDMAARLNSVLDVTSASADLAASPEPPRCEECVHDGGVCDVTYCKDGRTCTCVSRRYDHCRYERDADGDCGPSGRLWKARVKNER